MLHLVYYLKCLAQFDDIRDQNRKAFQLKELESSNINEFLEGFSGPEESQHGKDSETMIVYEEEGEGSTSMLGSTGDEISTLNKQVNVQENEKTGSRDRKNN